MTAASEAIATAIETLEIISRERGVENGWLWEIPKGAPYGWGPDDDPRSPLVKGGPDVVLQLAVVPMLALLRSPLAELDEPIVALALAIAEGRAIEVEHPVTTVTTLPATGGSKPAKRDAAVKRLQELEDEERIEAVVRRDAGNKEGRRVSLARADAFALARDIVNGVAF